MRVDYTCNMIDIVEALPDTRAGNYIAGQLVKSCHSPTFNYGEAQGAEGALGGRLAVMKPGSQVAVGVIRNGIPQTILVTVGTAPTVPSATAQQQPPERSAEPQGPGRGAAHGRHLRARMNSSSARRSRRICRGASGRRDRRS